MAEEKILGGSFVGSMEDLRKIEEPSDMRDLKTAAAIVYANSGAIDSGNKKLSKLAIAFGIPDEQVELAENGSNESLLELAKWVLWDLGEEG